MDVVCESCGELNRSAGEFCTSCGAFLAWEETSATASTQPQHPAPQAKADHDQPTVDHGAGKRTPGQDQQPVTEPRPSRPQPTRQPSSQQSFRHRAQQSSQPPSQPTRQPTAQGPVCPNCARENDPGRRFCARCGQQLAPARSGPVRSAPNVAATRSRERAGLRAFRDSLPDVYRWRRVGLVVLVVGLVTAFMIASGGRPVDWVRARWYDVRGTLVVVPGVQATVIAPTSNGSDGGTGGGGTGASKGKKGKQAKPKDPGVQFTDPAALTDGSVAAWTTDWTVTGPAGGCGGAPGTPAIELSLAQPTRIRAIAVRAGLGADRSERPLQFRPERIGVTAGGACQVFSLADKAEPQRLELDTRRPVSVIRIGVDSAYPRRDDGQDRLSFTEITLLSRPGH